MLTAARSTQTVFARANLGNTLVGPGSASANTFQNVVNVSNFNNTNFPATDGTSVDFGPYQALAAADPTGNQLVNDLNRFFLHNTMPSAMRQSILTAVQAVPAGAANRSRKQAATALYLVFTSAQWNVQR